MGKKNRNKGQQGGGDDDEKRAPTRGLTLGAFLATPETACLDLATAPSDLATSLGEGAGAGTAQGSGAYASGGGDGAGYDDRSSCSYQVGATKKGGIPVLVETRRSGKKVSCWTGGI